MVCSRFARRLRDTGDGPLRGDFAWLESADSGARGRQEFVNWLTTNLTSFVREPHHFDAFPEELHRYSSSTLSVRCSAAATAENPWSIAMTLAEPLRAGVEVRILADDIDVRMLASAARAA
jgi:chemotaxis protein methyltransferase CheR